VEVLDHREELDVRVVVVSFAAPASLAAYRERLGLEDALLLSDTDRAAYAAFGFDRASVARAYLHPRVWWRYATLLVRGRRLERPEEDTLQLGGDVLVDRDGVVRWTYRSRGPEDRPSLAEVRRQAAAVASGSRPSQAP
jgi:hypothetical protein